MENTSQVLATSANRKVHLAWGHTLKPLCNRDQVSDIVAQLPESGQEHTVSALLTAKVAPSRLCGHCFYPRFRAIYKAAAKTSLNAAPKTSGLPFGTQCLDADGTTWERQGNSDRWSQPGVNGHAVGCPTTEQLRPWGPFKLLTT